MFEHSGGRAMSNRRAFLKFLAGSPLLAAMPSVRWALARSAGAQSPESVIASAADAINVFDLEAAARKALPPAHWGYMATGVDSDGTLQANRAAIPHYQPRTRVFADVRQIDMCTELLAATCQIPIVRTTAASQGAC